MRVMDICSATVSKRRRRLFCGENTFYLAASTGLDERQNISYMKFLRARLRQSFKNIASQISAHATCIKTSMILGDEQEFVS